ncbi:hypothetical protein B0I24_11927 [Aliidiomarina maris]|uniref:Uncharacterized protein n=1 Tax=Aliidiomarina maris TaxID=531312 RepID=A0A327WP96_9GAMM|nr:hypothetical protein B0I24_11927 [Aliidiomarina maris]
MFEPLFICLSTQLVTFMPTMFVLHAFVKVCKGNGDYGQPS